GDLAGVLRHREALDARHAGAAGQQRVGELRVGGAQRRGRAYAGDPDRARGTHRGASAGTAAGWDRATRNGGAASIGRGVMVGRLSLRSLASQVNSTRLT